MTALAATPVGSTRGTAVTHLIHGEYLKIRTTNTWWTLGLGTIGTTALAVLVNCAQAHQYLFGDRPTDADAAATWDLQHNVVAQAANIFTSGQFFGALFAMLLAILMITNEYHHQTATTTFLTTPHRTSVILAKFATGMLASAFFWLITTVLSLIGGSIYFRTEGLDSHLGDWQVIRAILINLAVFALWAVFGVGLGVLIRSQLGATITAALLYVVGTTLAQVIFFLIHQYLIHRDGVFTAMVIVPATAAQVATAPTKTFPQSPPEWVGAAVLVAYGLIMGAIGTLIVRRRDVT